MIIDHSNNNCIDFDFKKSIKLFTKLFINWIFVSKKSEITYLFFLTYLLFQNFYILFFPNILSPFIDFQKKQLFLSLDTIVVKNFN